MDRLGRQREIHEWAARTFGADQASSIPQRGIRLVEEAIEAAQSAGCDMAMVHKLVDYVYARPPGKLAQELGGVGVTLLCLAEAAMLSADICEKDEIERIKSNPIEHFRARNQTKNDAGFEAAFPPSSPVERRTGERRAIVSKIWRDGAFGQPDMVYLPRGEQRPDTRGSEPDRRASATGREE